MSSCGSTIKPLYDYRMAFPQDIYERQHLFNIMLLSSAWYKTLVLDEKGLFGGLLPMHRGGAFLFSGIFRLVLWWLPRRFHKNPWLMHNSAPPLWFAWPFSTSCFIIIRVCYKCHHNDDDAIGFNLKFKFNFFFPMLVTLGRWFSLSENFLFWATTSHLSWFSSSFSILIMVDTMPLQSNTNIFWRVQSNCNNLDLHMSPPVLL